AELCFGIVAVGEFAECIHFKLDTLDVGWGDTLDFALRNPACSHRRTLAILENRVSGNIMANSTVSVVPILQVRNSVVPVVALEAAEVGPRHIATIGFHFKLRLKCEGLVTLLVGSGFPA